MTTQSITPPIPSPSQTLGRTRLLLVIVAILVLTAAAFVVGRVTDNSGSTRANVPASVPATSTQTPASNDTGVCQHYGHYYSAAC